MREDIIVLGVIIATVILLFFVLPRVFGFFYGRWVRRGAEAVTLDHNDELLRDIPSGKVALVYFTATWSAPCIRQKPIIDAVMASHDDVHLIKVDITDNQHLDIARRWGVREIPRTFIIDHNRHPLITNMDIVDERTLNRQLDEARRAGFNRPPLRFEYPQK